MDEKSEKAPVPIKKARPAPLEDEPDEMPKAKPKSPGILGTSLSRAIIISTVLVCAVALTPLMLSHRYTLVAASRGDNALAFRIDTLTGRVSLCAATQCMPVAEKDKD